jgi:predicted ATPase/Tfp pilus assembly protein PilF
MRLLALTGRRSEALAQYVTYSRVLARELDAAPSAEMTLLYQQIKNEDPDLTLTTRMTGRGSQTPGHNLPRSSSPFIGRQDEIVRLAAQLDSPNYRLVTILGTGGVGKTRLALQVATEQGGAFDDGIYWVPLAALDSPDLLTSAIAQATGLLFAAEADPRAQLLDHLRDKELLLVLDNFEHLLSAEGGTAVDLLVLILKSAPRVSMLVTSRERLGLQAEYLLDLSGLPLPSGAASTLTASSPAETRAPDALTELMQFGAVQLFVERAYQSNSAFTLSADTAQGVVDICTLVGGLPLGIVLAAAWTRHFSPARIAGAIRANLDFLTSSLRDATPQHASLRAVFNHSWNLLSEEERRLFRAVSVFRGGWEEAAAESVTRAAWPALLTLVDKSLLRRNADGRFGMHEVLRQYATEKLAEVPAEQYDIRRRHAEYYLQLAQLAEPGLQTDRQSEWLHRLDREHDNFRAALHWARENREVEIGLSLGGVLWRFWYVRGYYSEGREQLAALLAMPTAPGAEGSRDTNLMRARARVLNSAGIFAALQGELKVARGMYEQSLTLWRELGDKQGIASSLSNLGIIAHQEGAPDIAKTLHEESLALGRELADKRGIAVSLNNLGLALQELGDYHQAGTLYEESLALRRELGDTLGIAGSLGNLGLVAQALRDYDKARTLYQESLALRRELEDRAGMAELFSNLGAIEQKQGNYAAARDLYEEGLALARELGYKWSTALLLNNLGLIAQERRDYDSAQTLHEESLALRRESGEKIGIAVSLISLGVLWVRRSSQDWEQRVLVSEPRPPAGELERAATLFGAVKTLLESSTSVLSIDDWQLYEQNRDLVRSLLDEEAFARAWERGRSMDLEGAILYVKGTQV